MGYLKIPNSYQVPSIFLESELWALEKIHGTSAHVRFTPPPEAFGGFEAEPWKASVSYFSGEQSQRFPALFDEDALLAAFAGLHRSLLPVRSYLVVHGEAYGGKIQGMSATYGPDMHFVAFDVRVGDEWLDVPDAHRVASALGFEFVDYARISGSVAEADAQRDLPSAQARRNGVAGDRVREGVVLRPVKEKVHEDGVRRGERLIAKHKGEAFRETQKVRVPNLGRIEVLREAQAIADEWVTPNRLEHVLATLRRLRIESGAGETPWSLVDTGDVCRAMHRDVEVEAREEIEWTQDARKAVGTAAAKLFKAKIRSNPGELAA